MFTIDYKPQFTDIDIKPTLNDSDLPGMIDAAEAIGVAVTHPKLKAAREASAAADSIVTQAAEHRDPAAGEATKLQAVADYAAGTIDAAAFIDRVARAILAADTKAGVQSAFTQAEAIQRKAANREAASLGDEWVNLLRPVLEARLTKVKAAADAVPARILDVTTSDVESDRELRNAWLHYGDVLADLYEVHQLADALRNACAIPVSGTYLDPQDYRWRHPDLLRGSTSNALSFWLLNYRRGAEPGIFTQAEVDAGKAEAAAARESAVKEPAAKRTARGRVA